MESVRKILLVPLKETTGTINQDSRFPGQARTPDVQNTKQTLQTQHHKLYMIHDPSIIRIYTIMVPTMHVSILGISSDFILYFNVSNLCISNPRRWSYGLPKHVGLHCVYKIILICSFVGTIIVYNTTFGTTCKQTCTQKSLYRRPR
jgi:hypothetical protein